jgi:hypothetical protein
MFPLAALPSGLPLAFGTVVLLALAVVVGEVFYTAGSWGLVYELAPEESLGQYQGFFNIGFDLSMMLGPALFAWLIADQSMVGWGVLSMRSDHGYNAASGVRHAAAVGVSAGR